MFFQAQKVRGNTATVTWLMEVSNVIELKQKLAISAALSDVLMALPLSAFNSGLHKIAATATIVDIECISVIVVAMITGE